MSVGRVRSSGACVRGGKLSQTVNAPAVPIRAATRLRRPSYRDPRLIAGLLLVTASVVTGAKVVSSFDETTPHYVAAHPLAPGDRLSAADLRVVDVNLGPGAPVYLSTAVAAEGLLVTQRVGADGLVPLDAVAQDGEVGQQPVTLAVSSATVAGLVEGDLVDVWVSGPDPEKTSTYLKPQLQVHAAQVKKRGEPTSALTVSGGRSLTVLVPERKIADLLDAVANNAKISLVAVRGAAS